MDDAPQEPELLAALQSALAGTHQIERELGGGGMSRVFLARDLLLGRQVVVKVLPPEVAETLSAERFRREMMLSARLQHPHIVPILTAGDAQGLLYYIMPYVAGESLRERLRRDGARTVPAGLRILRDIADALNHAHGAGVVHRDIKPDNILLSAEHAYLADFGIAKALAGTAVPRDGTLTQVGMSVGTPAYMSPEQVAGDADVDHRSDIYSLGLVAYELFAGQPAFRATSAQQWMAAHLVEMPTPLGEIRPELPPALSALVMQCLAKDPADRPGDCSGFIQLAGTPSREYPVGPEVEVTSPKRGKRRAVGGGRYRLTVVAAGAVLAATLAVGVPVLTRTAELDTSAVIILPFTNQAHEPSLAPLGVLAADYLTAGVTEAGVARVIAVNPRPEDAAADQAREAGAAHALIGSFIRMGDSVHFQVTLVDARSGDVRRSFPVVRAHVAQPARGLELLRQRVVSGLAIESARQAQRSYFTRGEDSPTYLAYEAQLRGFEASQTRGDWVQALRHFTDAARADTSWLTPRVWTARALSRLERYDAADSAIASLEPHRAHMPRALEAFFDRTVADQRGDLIGALAAARRMVDADPGPLAMQTVVTYAHRAGKAREALAAQAQAPLESLPALRVLPSRWDRLRALHHRLGEYDAEVRVADRMVAFLPEDPFRFVIRASAQAARGNAPAMHALVDTLMREALGRPQELAMWLSSIATTAAAHGRPGDAMAVHARAVAAAGDASAFSGASERRIELAEVLYAAGRFPEAKRALSDIPEATLAVLGLRALVAEGLRTRDRVAEAALVNRRDRDFGERRYWQARLAAAQGRPADAVRLLREAYTAGYPIHLPYGDLHHNPDFLVLRDYQPFIDVVRAGL